MEPDSIKFLSMHHLRELIYVRNVEIRCLKSNATNILLLNVACHLF
jgi:hypothetical protein